MLPAEHFTPKGHLPSEVASQHPVMHHIPAHVVRCPSAHPPVSHTSVTDQVKQLVHLQILVSQLNTDVDMWP